jgi:hypothetical protein
MAFCLLTPGLLSDSDDNSQPAAYFCLSFWFLVFSPWFDPNGQWSLVHGPPPLGSRSRTRTRPAPRLIRRPALTPAYRLSISITGIQIIQTATYDHHLQWACPTATLTGHVGTERRSDRYISNMGATAGVCSCWCNWWRCGI